MAPREKVLPAKNLPPRSSGRKLIDWFGLGDSIKYLSSTCISYHEFLFKIPFLLAADVATVMAKSLEAVVGEQTITTPPPAAAATASPITSTLFRPTHPNLLAEPSSRNIPRPVKRSRRNEEKEGCKIHSSRAGKKLE